MLVSGLLSICVQVLASFYISYVVLFFLLFRVDNASFLTGMWEHVIYSILKYKMFGAHNISVNYNITLTTKVTTILSLLVIVSLSAWLASLSYIFCYVTCHAVSYITKCVVTLLSLYILAMLLVQVLFNFHETSAVYT